MNLAVGGKALLGELKDAVRRRTVLRLGMAALAVALSGRTAAAAGPADDEIVIVDGWILLPSDLDPAQNDPGRE